MESHHRNTNSTSNPIQSNPTPNTNSTSFPVFVSVCGCYMKVFQMSSQGSGQERCDLYLDAFGAIYVIYYQSLENHVY